MQLAAANRRYDQLHKEKPFHDGTFRIWMEKPSQLTPFHYRDGVTIWISEEDLTSADDDDFLEQRSGADPFQAASPGDDEDNAR